MGSFLRILYRFSSAYWTTKAAQRGRLPQRMARRSAYRITGQMIRRMFR